MYAVVVGNPIILDASMEKVDTLTGQLDVFEGVLDYCDGYTYDGMDDERRENAINDCLDVISRYGITNVPDVPGK